MSLATVRGLALRCFAGSAASTLAGVLAFQEEVFQASGPAFQCIVIGVLASLILGLVRESLFVEALAAPCVFGVFQFWGSWWGGLGRATAMLCWSLFIGFGLFLVAVVYDRLANMGYRFGKFLLAGPLLSGVYVAATPLAALSGARPDAIFHSLVQNAFLGLVIGDGAALGVELLEMLPGFRRAPGLVAGGAAGRGTDAVVETLSDRSG